MKLKPPDASCGCSGIGIRQNVAFSLPRPWLVLFDYEHESRENHGPKNAGCKPSSITIETSDYVACHWNTFLCSDLLAFWTWFPHSGNTLRKRVGAHIKLLVTPIWMPEIPLVGLRTVECVGCELETWP